MAWYWEATATDKVPDASWIEHVCSNCGYIGDFDGIGPEDDPRYRGGVLEQCPKCRAVETDVTILNGRMI